MFNVYSINGEFAVNYVWDFSVTEQGEVRYLVGSV